MGVQIERNDFFPYRFEFRGMPDVRDLDLVRHPDSPWIAEIEEPLPVGAPANAKPWCCYLDTVIFYEQPYRVIDKNFAEYGRCETRLRIDDVLQSHGEVWKVQGGSCGFTKGVWHMVWRLRRQEKQEEPSDG